MMLNKKIQPNTDRLTPNEKILIMEKFTQTYKKYSYGNIALREAMCLKQQYPATLCDIEEGDLFAGRYIYLPLCFTPQATFGMGYAFSQSDCKKLLEEETVTAKNKEALKAIIKFWQTQNTKNQIRNAYTDTMKKYFQEDTDNRSGIGFPLYRMSGSHLDLKKLVEKGIPGLINEIKINKDKNIELFTAMESTLQTLIDVCLYYKEQAINLSTHTTNQEWENELLQMSATLENITNQKPSTFREAIQLVHLYVLISDSRNYGRMDDYLGDLYASDIDSGRITEATARMLLEGFWKLIIAREIVFDGRVVLGGKGRANEKNADRFALLAMETSKNLKEVLPQLTLRCYKGMDKQVYEKAIEVIGEGTTFPMLYNDDVNIPSVAKAFDVTMDEATNYIPYGCGEYVLYHRSFGTPSGAINVLQALDVTLRNGVDPITKNIQGLQLGNLSDFQTFDELYNAYCKQITFFVELLADQEELEYKIASENASYLYFSMLFDDCIEKGKAIFSGGITYLGGTLETYGNTNTADSLTAIKYHIYDHKNISNVELMKAIDANFMGYEHIQKMLLAAPKYGNDDETADEMAKKLHNFICTTIRNQRERTKLHSYLGVIINNSMNTIFGLNTGASADGRMSGTHMANANNPTGGMDKNGLTAILNSLTKLDTTIHAGSVQNMKFSKEMFTRLLPKTKALIEAYFNIGGSQAMITVLSKSDLENAMKEPEKYPNIVVRVGGFSAKFVELSKEVQKDIISRTLY